jgi:hypothetical protein
MQVGIHSTRNRWQDTHVRVTGLGLRAGTPGSISKKKVKGCTKYKHNCKSLLKINVTPNEGPHVTHRVHIYQSNRPVPETIRTSSSNVGGVGGGCGQGGEPRKPLSFRKLRSVPETSPSFQDFWLFL